MLVLNPMTTLRRFYKSRYKLLSYVLRITLAVSCGCNYLVDVISVCSPITTPKSLWEKSKCFIRKKTKALSVLATFVRIRTFEYHLKMQCKWRILFFCTLMLYNHNLHFFTLNVGVFVSVV